MWHPLPSSPHPLKLIILNLPDAVPQWPSSVEILPMSMNIATTRKLPGIYGTDIESDIGVNTTVAVREYCGAPTARLYKLQDYIMNTDMAMSRFSAFLGLPQLILCRDDD